MKLSEISCKAKLKGEIDGSTDALPVWVMVTMGR